MTKKKPPPRNDVEGVLQFLGAQAKVIEYRKKRSIFVQGEPADAVFYITKGRVKLTLISAQDKAAIIGVLNGSARLYSYAVNGGPPGSVRHDRRSSDELGYEHR